MRIQIINGPNINLLGKREPSIYGSVTFEEYLGELRKKYPDVELGYFQSNVEGEMIDKIQQTGFDVDGIILNAGAYTHTSSALQDAIRSVPSPVIEDYKENQSLYFGVCGWLNIQYRGSGNSYSKFPEEKINIG